MIMKKKTISLVMTAVMLAAMITGCGNKASSQSDMDYIKDKGTLIVGITDFAPMDYQEGGEWIGFDADLARKVAADLGVEVKFEEIDTSTAYKNGDLNGDGALNVADLVMMSRFIKGMTSLDEAQTKSADLNGDGNVDIFDMVEFRKKILESMRDN